MMKKINILICICMAFLMFPIYAAAVDIADKASVEVEYPVSDAVVAFYKVADKTEDNTYKIAKTFEHYIDEVQYLSKLNDNIDSLTTTEKVSLAVTLKVYVVADQISSSYTAYTDSEGKARIDTLEEGLYLVYGDIVEIEGKLYASAPVLVNVLKGTEPLKLDFSGKITPHNMSGKYEVVKIWKEDENKANRPEYIEVALYRDGEEYDRVILEEENHWKFEWENLEAGPEWMVVEEGIPDGYKVKYDMGDGYAGIENEYILEDTPDDTPKDTPDGTPEGTPGPGSSSSPGGRLPQTGQLWWPVPFLAIMGIILFSIGWLRRQSEVK